LNKKVKWIHNYIEKNHHNSNCLIFELHRTFYAICQTVFYIIIFRNRQLFNEDSALPVTSQNSNKSTLSLVKAWKLNEIVSCKLNPLRYCLPTVRDKFAKITYIHQIAYCYKIIDANNRIALPISSNISSNFQSTSVKSLIGADGEKITNVNSSVSNNPLDSFFPFDPYLLTRSKSIIEKHYVEFKDVVDEDMNDDDEEDEDEDDEEDSDEEMSAEESDMSDENESDTVGNSKCNDFASLKSQVNNKNLFDFDDSDLENSIE
jgi:RNA polymerase I-specific transcription initiation factor RRN3